MHRPADVKSVAPTIETRNSNNDTNEQETADAVPEDQKVKITILWSNFDK